MNRQGWQQVISLVLVAPLLLFLIVFFAFPLVTMMKSAVSDAVAARAHPATASRLRDGIASALQPKK